MLLPVVEVLEGGRVRIEEVRVLAVGSEAWAALLDVEVGVDALEH